MNILATRWVRLGLSGGLMALCMLLSSCEKPMSRDREVPESRTVEVTLYLEVNNDASLAPDQRPGLTQEVRGIASAQLTPNGPSIVVYKQDFVATGKVLTLSLPVVPPTSAQQTTKYVVEFEPFYAEYNTGSKRIRCQYGPKTVTLNLSYNQSYHKERVVFTADTSTEIPAEK